MKYHERVKAIMGAHPSVKAQWRMVLIALADHCRNEESHCWPSQERLAEMAGLKRRAVINIVKRMTAAGILIAETRPGMSTQYMIDWSKLSEGVHAVHMCTKDTRARKTQGVCTRCTRRKKEGEKRRKKLKPPVVPLLGTPRRLLWKTPRLTHSLWKSLSRPRSRNGNAPRP